MPVKKISFEKKQEHYRSKHAGKAWRDGQVRDKMRSAKQVLAENEIYAAVSVSYADGPK